MFPDLNNIPFVEDIISGIPPMSAPNTGVPKHRDSIIYKGLFS